MKEKKDRERFSIKFNENDPAHDAVIRLLEKQGPHSKAQFLVNAVLHYVNCTETPDISLAQTVDRASIEKIVMDILGSKNSRQQDTDNGFGFIRATKEESVPIGLPKQNMNVELKQEDMDETAWAMIVDTMSAFRNS